jgi:hypothetical protein
MAPSKTLWHWCTAGALLALAFAAATPADAQRYYGRGGGGGGFFDSLFGPRSGYWGPQQRQYQSNEPRGDVDSSRAPAAKKSDTTPTMTVMVLGDSMADWLAYGLEDAFSDAPEIGVIRKAKTHSGLIRYESRSDLDWWHVARDLLGKEKVDYVVMMLGVEDRASIRETAADKPADKSDKKKPDAAKDAKTENAKSEAKADTKNDDDEAGETPSVLAPESKRSTGGVAEFRTERGEQIYTRRIDDTIAALKSKGVPVIWVGLPPIRGTRSTADAGYLNDLYRARAEHAGIVYVDVWDGFVDENGKFTYMGPDFEGQNRRLRSGDGVHFTKAGARKLAHYVERELRRFMSNRAMPMAMPSSPQLQNAPSEPAARPVAGPVMPLTTAASGGDELLGGGASRPAHSDPVATRVLVKGEPVAPAVGRADDFKWPRGSDAGAAAPPPPTTAAPRAEPASPLKPAQPTPKPDAKQAVREPAKDADKNKTAEKPKTTKPQATGQSQPRPPSTTQQPRPPQPVQQRQSGGLFGLFR